MLIIVVGVLASATAYLLGYRMNVTTATVPAPTTASSPEDVVRAYVDAYDHRDFTTMAAIYPSQSFDRHRAIGTMSDLTITDGQAMTGTEHGYSAKPGVSYYQVRVTVRLSGLTGSDLAYSPGPNGWAYDLERTSSAEPWHISDHGNP
ncbi:MAG: hypothetical protein ACRYG2_29295 [Janthinobacterium lividum]